MKEVKNELNENVMQSPAPIGDPSANVAPIVTNDEPDFAGDDAVKENPAPDVKPEATKPAPTVKSAADAKKEKAKDDEIAALKAQIAEMEAAKEAAQSEPEEVETPKIAEVKTEVKTKAQKQFEFENEKIDVYIERDKTGKLGRFYVQVNDYKVSLERGLTHKLPRFVARVIVNKHKQEASYAKLQAEYSENIVQ